VRALANKVSEEVDRLDALVNNAGIGTTIAGDGRRMQSRDGYELRFAVNYLAGYLLTRLLLPTIERSAPARIVNVSSAGQAPIEAQARRQLRELSDRLCGLPWAQAAIVAWTDDADGDPCRSNTLTS
jgi:NAD(P)-dependent dehydrogenase (short-subunit alcohol dehydrogenase family)